MRPDVFFIDWIFYLSVIGSARFDPIDEKLDFVQRQFAGRRHDPSNLLGINLFLDQ
jgi:hypothetical protein